MKIISYTTNKNIFIYPLRCQITLSVWNTHLYSAKKFIFKLTLYKLLIENIAYM